MGEQEQDGRKTALTRRRDAAIEEYGEDFVFGLVELGQSAREIANTIGLDGKDKRVRWSVYNFLQSDAERYQKARERSVEALSDRALQIYGDEPPETTADGTWRDRKAGHLRWLAELRSGFKKDGVNVSLDFGQLHLQALRNSGQMPNRVPVEEVQEAEYELEEGENPRDRYAKKQLGTIPDER